MGRNSAPRSGNVQDRERKRKGGGAIKQSPFAKRRHSKKTQVMRRGMSGVHMSESMQGAL